MGEQTSGGSSRVATGIGGLDHILGGGLPANAMCIVLGTPGTGRTTLALQFLQAGLEAGETVLYATMAQSRERLVSIAASHGWSIDGMEIYENEVVQPDGQMVLHTAEVELSETVDALVEAIRRVRPDRLVIDTVVEIRHLSGEAHRYRRELLRLRREIGSECTVLFLDLDYGRTTDAEIQSMADGIIELEQRAPEYGDVQRRLKVTKMRGVAYHGGYHNFRIRCGGFDVFTRLGVEAQGEYRTHYELGSGVRDLDAVIGGGLQLGTSCVLLGAAGTGKTTVALLYAIAAAEKDEHAAIFAFDERPQTMIQRADGLGMPLRTYVENGRVRLQQIETGQLTSGEFTQMVRSAVDDDGARVIVIDTITGYFHAMPQESLLLPQIHELLSFTARRGVLTILCVAQHGVMGTEIASPIDVSYVADAVLLLRHFDDGGTIRRTLSALVKRYGQHAHTIHELDITAEGVEIGPPIRDINGILSGSPRHVPKAPEADEGESHRGEA